MVSTWTSGPQPVAGVNARPSTLAGTCLTGPEGSSPGRARAVTSRYGVADGYVALRGLATRLGSHGGFVSRWTLSIDDGA
ncbi:hypothetical protein [Streptomyces lavendofoliae]|uniref:hypothetical protein n=1 Tax=Streptomyces lavendofoliae TaxID=67314 RepID=UPI003D9484E0